MVDRLWILVYLGALDLVAPAQTVHTSDHITSFSFNVRPRFANTSAPHLSHQRARSRTLISPSRRQDAYTLVIAR